MAKVTLTDITDLENDPSQAQTAINANNATIEQQLDLLLSRDSEQPNQILADVDLGGMRIINLGAPESGTDMARVIDAERLIYELLGLEYGDTGTENGVSLVDVLRLVEGVVGPLTVE